MFFIKFKILYSGLLEEKEKLTVKHEKRKINKTKKKKNHNLSFEIVFLF